MQGQQCDIMIDEELPTCREADSMVKSRSVPGGCSPRQATNQFHKALSWQLD